MKSLLKTIFLLFIIVSSASAQTIPTPKSFFGFNIGDDYMLTNYTKASQYYKAVADASDRVVLQSIGKTEEGREQYMMIISSPENIKNLDHYRQISQKLARAESLSDEEAHRLAEEGKAVVWIDGGLHANETLGSHQLIETLYQLASRQDAETKRILNDVIVLLVQANPDGQEIVADWYMRKDDPTKRDMRIPRTYNKYIGHDNNRDFYMNNMKESQNMSRIMYVDWLPQIMYNHHQTAPAGAIVAGPPFTDPFSYFFDPLLVTGIDGVGAAMISRLNLQGKPGYTRMKGSVFSVWYNGGLRTTTYFHNIIGLLTETWGNPTPSNVPLVPDRILPTANTPNPIMPQEKWHFRQSIDYSVEMNYAVLDYASRNSDHLLYNIYKMGRNSIQKGSEDHWTLTPQKADSVKAEVARNRSNRSNVNTGGAQNNNLKPFNDVLRNPDNRDPRAYIIPADQIDFFTAVKFVNALIKTGIRIEKADKDFSVNGKNYPAGSYIIKTDQAFRPHVLDMFEPQDYPNDFEYPGGPPIRPYDQAGWTLAYQMGIQFDRILDAFDGPFETLPYGELQQMPSRSVGNSGNGYVLDAAANNSFIAVNNLLQNKVPVYRIDNGAEKENFYVPSSGKNELNKLATSMGIQTRTAPKGVPKTKIEASRIALFDRYGGSMPSGWTRWILEQFDFPVNVVYAEELDKGGLNEKYDVILFIDTYLNMPERFRRFANQPDPSDIPEEYRNRLTNFTVEKTLPRLREFMEKGGRIITTGQSTSMAYLLNLPVRNALTTINKEGKVQNLSANDVYIPGSVLLAVIDNTLPENSGMGTSANMMFTQSNVFSLNPGAVEQGIRPVAWFSEDNPLKSGWAWGSSWLHDGVVAFTAPVGNGKFYACSTQIMFRGQPYGTFKMLFNQLYK